MSSAHSVASLLFKLWLGDWCWHGHRRWILKLTPTQLLVVTESVRLQVQSLESRVQAESNTKEAALRAAKEHQDRAQAEAKAKEEALRAASEQVLYARAEISPTRTPD